MSPATATLMHSTPGHEASGDGTDVVSGALVSLLEFEAPSVGTGKAVCVGVDSGETDVLDASGPSAEGPSVQAPSAKDSASTGNKARGFRARTKAD